MNRRTRNLVIAGVAVATVGFIGVNVLMPPAPPPAAGAVAGGVAAPDTVGAAPSAAGAPANASPAGPGGAVGEVGAVPGAATPLDPRGAAGEVTAGAGTSPGGAAPAPDDRRSYAIGLQDLAGLPPDAAPGQPLELWVTWERPLTEEPRLQKLIADVVLERIIPGPVPEAPVTVLLSVPAARVGDLIYGDGFGRLSAVLPG